MAKRQPKKPAEIYSREFVAHTRLDLQEKIDDEIATTTDELVSIVYVGGATFWVFFREKAD